MTDAARGRLETALILLIGAWFLVPRLIQTLSLAKGVHTAVGGQQPPYTGLASAAQRGLFYLTIGLCLWIIVLLWRRSPSRRGLALIVFLLPWAYLVIRDQYAQQRPENIYELMPVLAVAIWMLRPRIARLQVLGYVVGVTIVASLLVGIALPGHGIQRNAAGALVTVDKQILPGGELVGIFSDANSLGQFIALGLPAVMLIRARGWRIVIALCGLFALVWCASRSSMYAVALTIVVYLVVSRTRAHSRAFVAFLLLSIAFAAVCILPLITHDPAAFTNRGYIWQASQGAWAQHPLFGNGSDWFSVIGSSSASLGPTCVPRPQPVPPVAGHWRRRPRGAGRRPHCDRYDQRSPAGRPGSSLRRELSRRARGHVRVRSVPGHRRQQPALPGGRPAVVVHFVHGRPR